MVHRSRLLVFAALLLAGTPALLGARGNWYDPYLDAIDALESGDAAGALPLLEQALERKSESGYFRTYGTNYVRYAPHMQLARARHALGECEAALGALEHAGAAGEIASEARFETQAEAIRAACAPKPALIPEETPPPVVNPEPAAPVKPSVDAKAFERGLLAYLSGDLETARRVLQKVALEAPESAVTQLLLGTVLHASWSAGGQLDASLHAGARQALERARNLDPLLAPPPGICPPEVRELYARAR